MRRGEGGNATAHAKVDDGDRPFLFEFVDGGLRVLEHRIPIGAGDELARIGDLVARVAALEVFLRPIEQGRRNGGVAFTGETIADGADVFVHAKDFLDDDHAAFGPAGRIGAIGAELVAVVGRQCELLTQIVLLFDYVPAWIFAADRY